MPVITSKEARNNILVSAVETLRKSDGIAEKWSKVKRDSSYDKNYELVWDNIKDLDAQSEDYRGVMWLAHATCRRSFHNTLTLEIN